MRLLTAEEMRSIDEEAIGTLGIPGSALMENAARGMYEEIKRANCKRVLIISGSGNNGLMG